MKPFSTFGLATVNIAATTTAASVALNKRNDAESCQVEIYNAGSATVFIRKGDSTVTATTSSRPLPAGAMVIDSVGSGVTHLSAITASGTATVYFTTGEGA